MKIRKNFIEFSYKDNLVKFDLKNVTQAQVSNNFLFYYSLMDGLHVLNLDDNKSFNIDLGNEEFYTFSQVSDEYGVGIVVAKSDRPEGELFWNNSLIMMGGMMKLKEIGVWR